MQNQGKQLIYKLLPELHFKNNIDYYIKLSLFVKQPFAKKYYNNKKALTITISFLKRKMQMIVFLYWYSLVKLAAVALYSCISMYYLIFVTSQ